MSYTIIQVVSTGFVLIVLLIIVRRVLDNGAKRIEKADEDRIKESDEEIREMMKKKLDYAEKMYQDYSKETNPSVKKDIYIDYILLQEDYPFIPDISFWLHTSMKGR